MRGFYVTEIDGVANSSVEPLAIEPSDAGDVFVAIDYSGLNYKDAMASVAPSAVRRQPRLVIGVDAAGVVTKSDNVEFPVGTRVSVHGGNYGTARDGGLATHTYAPGEFLCKLPDTLTTRDAMIIGTAGFTAMMSILALEDHGLEAGGEVLVSGASGGLGSQAVAYLAAKGYRPVAVTGSPENAQWLTSIGATSVIARDEVTDHPGRVLGTDRWDGAIDCVGGETLSAILRSLRYGAAVAASGLVGGNEVHTTVYPFIIRANALLGIDAVQTSHEKRQRVWAALAEVRPLVDLEVFVDAEVSLAGVAESLERVLAGKTRGRVLVHPAS